MLSRELGNGGIHPVLGALVDLAWLETAGVDRRADDDPYGPRTFQQSTATPVVTGVVRDRYERGI